MNQAANRLVAAADQIAGASGQVSNASQTLAQGASSQAASLSRPAQQSNSYRLARSKMLITPVKPMSWPKRLKRHLARAKKNRVVLPKKLPANGRFI